MSLNEVSSSIRSARRTLGAVLLVVLAACGSGDGGTGPSPADAPAAVRVVSGSGQTGNAGSALAEPLVVKVTSGTGAPVAGATVTFLVTSGNGTVAPSSAVTDATGQASTQLTLGAGTGPVQVTATVKGTSLVTSFSATTAGPPVIVACAPSDAVTLTPGQAMALSGASVCIAGGDAGSEYALVPFNGAADARSRASFTVLPTGILATTTPLADRLPRAAEGITATGLQASFEARLHARTAAELEPLIPAARAWYAARRAPSAERTARLSVIPGNVQVGALVRLNANSNDACANPDYRTARVQAVSTKAIVVADTTNPTGGYTQADYQSIAVTFDTLIDAVDTRNFGQPSDIDNNGHVILFFTSAVNALTPRNSSEYVGGFFDSRDLFPTQTSGGLTGCSASNVAEMFYLLVPDPGGMVNGNRFSKSFVTRVTLATTAHEYQHLINASRRLYVNTKSAQFEETWLDEGLAHVAEELLFYARAHLGPRQDLDASAIRRDTVVTNAFTEDGIDNFDRLSLYLANPLRNSPYADNDSLPTRGATWSFLRYAVDQVQPTAQETVWMRLVNSSSVGMGTLQAVFGTDLPNLFRDWATALILDDQPGAGARYQFPSWNLRSIYGMPSVLGYYPLLAPSLKNGTSTTALLSGGSAAYLRFAVAAGGTASLSWNALASSVSLTLVRLR